MSSPSFAPSLAARVPSGTAQRLVFLDTLRILAFALLVIYHVGMVYVSWDFHVKSPFAGTAIEPWMRLSSPWRMSLLFFVSGAATALMLRRGAHAGVHSGVHSGVHPSVHAGAWLGQRLKRLLLPLAFGIFVIVPPQAYVEVMHKYGYAGSALEFMRLYVSAWGGFCNAAGRCLILPTWNHLWFLPYLAAYTALLWLGLRLRPTLLDTASQYTPHALRGWRLLALPMIALIAARAALGRHFPITHAFVDDVFAHAMYLPIFMLGAACARAQVWPKFEASRWPALGLSAIAWLGIATAPTSSWAWLAATVMQWSAIVAAVGFGHRWLNRDFAWRRTLTEAIFPVYLLHQTFIVLFVWWLMPLRIDPRVEGPLIVVATFAACAASYLAVRRVRWLRPLFGLAAGHKHLEPLSPMTQTRA